MTHLANVNRSYCFALDSSSFTSSVLLLHITLRQHNTYYQQLEEGTAFLVVGEREVSLLLRDQHSYLASLEESSVSQFSKENKLTLSSNS